MGPSKLTAMSQAKMCDSAQISSNHGALRPRVSLGARLASLSAQALVLAVLGSLSGCVVTDPIDFEPPANNPPAFVMERPPKLQMGDIKYVRKQSAPSWTFTLRVRDQDVEQELEMQSRIVTSGEPRDRKATRIVPATGEQVREFSIVVDQGEIEPDTCHRIEIAVSGSFVRPFEDETEDLTRFADVEVENRFDVAIFTFWIWEGEPSANDPTKLVATCGAQPVQMTATAALDGGL
jgi:hypothetical protein